MCLCVFCRCRPGDVCTYRRPPWHEPSAPCHIDVVYQDEHMVREGGAHEHMVREGGACEQGGAQEEEEGGGSAANAPRGVAPSSTPRLQLGHLQGPLGGDRDGDL